MTRTCRFPNSWHGFPTHALAFLTALFFGVDLLRAGTVYVTNEKSGDVSIIDPATNQVTATIPVGKRPRGIHLSPDHKTVYVALSGRPIQKPGADGGEKPITVPLTSKFDGIGVVDLVAGKLKTLIPCGSDPEQFTLSPDGSRMYISNEDAGTATVLETASGKVLGTLHVGAEPEGVSITPDGRQVYITSEQTNTVYVIDTQSQAIVAQFKTGERPRGVAFTPDGSKAYITCETAGVICVVDVLTSKVIKQIAPTGVNVRPMGVAISPDGRRAYVTTGRGRTVLVIDTSSDQVQRVIEDVGTRPWGIGVSADGKRLYTANGPSERPVHGLETHATNWGIDTSASFVHLSV